MFLNNFDAGFGARGGAAGQAIMSERMVYFDNPQSVITLHPFTVTLVTITAPVGHVGGRPAILPAGMAAATDGGNYWVGTAAIRPQAAKKIEFVTTLYSATWADTKWVAGLAVVGTGVTAGIFGGTAPTDYALISKDTDTSTIVGRCRKASGTALAVDCNHSVPANATWQRLHVIMTRDADTAGKGRVQVAFGADSLEQVPTVLDYVFPTQFPDTVSMAMGFGWLSGANNTALSHGKFGWRIHA